jgi:hypothetical protein
VNRKVWQSAVEIFFLFQFFLVNFSECPLICSLKSLFTVEILFCGATSFLVRTDKQKQLWQAIEQTFLKCISVLSGRKIK